VLTLLTTNIRNATSVCLEIQSILRPNTIVIPCTFSQKQFSINTNMAFMELYKVLTPNTTRAILPCKTTLVVKRGGYAQLRVASLC
jgi:hypothetical protein